MAHIAQAEYSDHSLVPVDDRQSADFQPLHVPHGLGKVVVLPTAMDPRRHHVARRGAAEIEVGPRRVRRFQAALVPGGLFINGTARVQKITCEVGRRVVFETENALSRPPAWPLPLLAWDRRSVASLEAISQARAL
jgi:hypothetical protein